MSGNLNLARALVQKAAQTGRKPEARVRDLCKAVELIIKDLAKLETAGPKTSKHETAVPEPEKPPEERL